MVYGVQWNYQCGGPKSLLRFRLNSIEADVIYNLGESAEFTFCEGGKYILSSEGDLVDCAMGKVVGRLPFPKVEYSKH
ncbi:MAG: hypothetical protein A4E20_16590 [Nitrospira sp. SG-bin2]|nr:MAG: hypothetical protein A4E20_16590 [Nitrospira sp. SG-bin2]